jgi:hypothetical protein
MTSTMWRTALFVFLAYGYFGSFDNVLAWLGIMLVASGMDFVRQTVIRWDADENAARRD